jgi:hypothetical protein
MTTLHSSHRENEKKWTQKIYKSNEKNKTSHDLLVKCIENFLIYVF